MWRGGRVVEGAALEKQYALTGIEGSNPSFSAKEIVLNMPIRPFNFWNKYLVL